MFSKDPTCGLPGRFIRENVAPSSGTSLTTQPCPMSPPPFSPWIKIRPLIEWIGHLCSLLCPRWASVHPFFVGSICFTLVFRVVSRSMVICPPSLSFLLVFAKAVLCLLCYMFWSLKFLVLIFESIHVSQASLSLGPGCLSHPSLSTPMIHRSLSTPMMPFWLCSTRPPSSRQHLGQS